MQMSVSALNGDDFDTKDIYPSNTIDTNALHTRAGIDTSLIQSGS